MKRGLVYLVVQADRVFGSVTRLLLGAPKALTVAMFHAFLEDGEDQGPPSINTRYAVTVRQFRWFMETSRDAGYKFASPYDILSGLEPGVPHMLVTFDDGYANNLRALPVLEEFNAPCLVFVSANHVVHQKAFWWDVVYRYRTGSGHSHAAAIEETHALWSRPHDQIEAYILEQFGADALLPNGETDRPLTVAELVDLAAHRHIYIGNHTLDHVRLPLCPYDEMLRQIVEAQNVLKMMVSDVVPAIAYPGGYVNTTAIRAAREAGMQMGFSSSPTRNDLPLNAESNQRLTLGRYCLFGDRPIRQQVARLQSHVSLVELAARMTRRTKRTES